jgi:hypothetical protein
MISCADTNLWLFKNTMPIPLIKVYSIFPLKELMVKVRAHRLVDGDIITITGFYSIDKSIKIVEDDEKILIIVKK